MVLENLLNLKKASITGLVSALAISLVSCSNKQPVYNHYKIVSESTSTVLGQSPKCYMLKNTYNGFTSVMLERDVIKYCKTIKEQGRIGPLDDIVER